MNGELRNRIETTQEKKPNIKEVLRLHISYSLYEQENGMLETNIKEMMAVM